ncbi:exodeoxyribonuclease VII small subunit [Sphingomicrobium astaxanthinifaciens]|uniref:exodeoxyribonuclease VII small subunit n=1 Tax=Sphingomicrobium astaxanthinifaciens TaxID=1227949 RepID=UPI001FCB6C11|nr:exodeoxyribonuclease VII small subunit [Sphingomicrobium astaxanthinifaciens]MCJ7420605.1 exodeoxyribonuclease VII small subunit [Sphingomicrobium astaxanthinifaciens]
MTDAEHKPVADMAFEEALEELETIVRKLESGEEQLDASIALFQRGEALKKHCEARLDDARVRIEKITGGAAGQPAGTEPFDAG